jgi:hypothetical protein
VVVIDQTTQISPRYHFLVENESVFRAICATPHCKAQLPLLRLQLKVEMALCFAG